MGVKLNRVGMTVSGTPAAGNVTLGAAITDAANGDLQSFAAAGLANGQTTEVLFQDGNAWELSTVTYSTTGPSLTTRTLIKSSTGALLSLTAAAKVFAVPVAGEFASLEPGDFIISNRASIPGFLKGDGSRYANADYPALAAVFGDNYDPLTPPVVRRAQVDLDAYASFVMTDGTKAAIINTTDTTILSTTDFVTWTTSAAVASLGTTSWLYSAVNARWFLSGSAGGRYWYSPDAVTWTLGPAIGTSLVSNLCEGNGVILCTGNSGGTVVFRSTDGGLTWTAGVNPSGLGLAASFTLRFANGEFWAMGNQFLARSTDGLTWSAPITDFPWVGTSGIISGFGGKLYASITSGGLYVSTDGVSWVRKMPDTLTTFAVNNTFVLGDRLYAVQVAKIYHTTDLDTFYYANSPVSSFFNITVVNGKAYCVNAAGLVLELAERPDRLTHFSLPMAQPDLPGDLFVKT